MAFKSTFVPAIEERHARLLAELEPLVEELMAAHDAQRPLWFPSELLGPCLEPEGVDRLRHRLEDLPDPTRVAVALNLLTEEGLPHFHRMVAAHVGEHGAWQAWNNLWTAEEERHGVVLQGYCLATNLLAMPALERLKFTYLRTGLRLSYRANPYVLFVYTTLQERATQIAHARASQAVGAVEPLLAGILARLAAEEARHFTFYRRIFAEILARDPDAALAAAAEVMTGFAMPGRDIPGFADLAEVVRAAGIYGPRDYLAIVEQQIRSWRIEKLEGLSSEGRRHQAVILALPGKLARFAEVVEARGRPPRCEFEFLMRPGGGRAREPLQDAAATTRHP